MQINIADERIIIEALEFKLGSIESEQAQLDDSQEAKISELSNDIYKMEMLIDCLKDDYQQRLQALQEQQQELVGRSQEFERVAVPA